MTAAVTVDGVDKLNASLGRFERSLDDLSTPLGASGTKVLQDARRRAPVRSGRLSSSGFSTVTGTAATVGFGAPYAGPIEFGVGPRVGLRGPHNIRAVGFLGGALGDGQAAIVDTITTEVDDRLGDVKGA